MFINTKNVRILQTVKGLSVGNMLKKAGVPRGTWNVVLQRQRCSTKTVGKLAAALGCDVTDITSPYPLSINKESTESNWDLEAQYNNLITIGSIPKFNPGDLIIYRNGDRYEIGKIKSVTDDGAFVWYHEGETAAKTPFDCIHKLINGYVIKKNSLGGGEHGECKL